jgi:hypothetical protein
MNEAISGSERGTDPGFRFAHPGYASWFEISIRVFAPLPPDQRK